METRGGGVAGAGPAASTKQAGWNENGAPEGSARGDDSARRAPSKAVEGVGTAARWGASSRQPDQDGLEEGPVSMSPWQSPASQQAIFTGQWQPCLSGEGAPTLASDARGRSSVAAMTATSALAHLRDLLSRMTEPF
jgi:hypothetical protein